MIRIFFIGLFVLFVNFNFAMAQKVDLTSVDEFFKVASTLKSGKTVPDQQWRDFDSSTCYNVFAIRENKYLINTIKNSIYIAFGKGKKAEKDSILSIPNAAMLTDKNVFQKKLILINYLEISDNFDSIKWFRENYDFNALIKKSRKRLFSFLGREADSAIQFKPVNYFFIIADGKAGADALYIDLNFIFRQTETERINFLAHEYFHHYREFYKNHEFCKKCDLNFCLDMIQNEGIADMIDKSEGYAKYFEYVVKVPALTEIMIGLYNHAEKDLERLQNTVLQYVKKEISESEMNDKISEIAKYNGHHIGYFMAENIVKAGYKEELIKTFYNPYEFYLLYNKAAKTQNLLQLSYEFMDYLKKITSDYYH